MRYTVGEMAERTGIPATTLRYYDRRGLLPGLERTEGGQRVFRETDLETLLMIDCLKKSGLSLSEIRDFLVLAGQGDATIAERLALFQDRRRAVLEQAEALRETLALLDYKCWYYETAMEAGSEAAVQALPEEEIPQERRAARRKLMAAFDPDHR